MKTEDFVREWLKEHLSPFAEPVPKEEQEHFEQILLNICQDYGKLITNERNKSN